MEQFGYRIFVVQCPTCDNRQQVKQKLDRKVTIVRCSRCGKLMFRGGIFYGLLLSMAAVTGLIFITIAKILF